MWGERKTLIEGTHVGTNFNFLADDSTQGLLTAILSSQVSFESAKEVNSIFSTFWAQIDMKKKAHSP